MYRPINYRARITVFVYFLADIISRGKVMTAEYYFELTCRPFPPESFVPTSFPTLSSRTLLRNCPNCQHICAFSLCIRWMPQLLDFTQLFWAVTATVDPYVTGTNPLPLALYVPCFSFGAYFFLFNFISFSQRAYLFHPDLDDSVGERHLVRQVMICLTHIRILDSRDPQRRWILQIWIKICMI